MTSRMRMAVRLGTLVFTTLLLGSPLFTPSACAQIRAESTTGRARMELSVDHGYGFSSEGEYLELAMDLRIYAPEGLGVVLRTGLATQLMNLAYAADVGGAFRFDLFADDRVGLQVGLGGGLSVAYGPFDRGDAPAVGGFGMLHVDLRSRGMFFGVGMTAHALAVLGPADDAFDNTRTAPLWSVTPVLRIGGEWGL